MIVVEGCDGTGKTTLVNQLASHLGLQAHLGLQVGQRATPDRDKLYEVTRQDTYTALAHAVRGKDSPFIWDRLFFSEPIYSRVMKRKCQFKLDERKFVQSILHSLRCPVIFCWVPLETVQENLEGTHQMEGVNENVPFIHGAYESIAKSFEGATIYDYRVPGAYEALLEQTIRPFLRRRQDREWHS